jgi:hypothetical protein
MRWCVVCGLCVSCVCAREVCVKCVCVCVCVVCDLCLSCVTCECVLTEGFGGRKKRDLFFKENLEMIHLRAGAEATRVQWAL